MTSNQIAYWRNQEDIRAHQASERLQSRNISETERSNREQERLKEMQTNETIRHNFVTEEFDRMKVALEKRGLDLKNADQLLQLAEYYAKYGADMGNMSKQQEVELFTALYGDDYTKNPKSFNYHDEDIWDVLHMGLQEVGEAWKDFWSIGKAASALF